MITIKKSNTLLCIVLFFTPYVLANSASAVDSNASNNEQPNITITNKKTPKNKELPSTQPLSTTKELKLTQIIIDIDTPDDYVFGIYPNNNKNKNRVDNPDILWPSGTVKIYDIQNNKLISEIALDPETKETITNRNLNTDGVLFLVPIKNKSKYLITPKINVQSDGEIDPTYSFSIHRQVFVK